MTDFLNYDFMVDDALRSVMVSALRLVEHQGLPGDHHFYITFRTDHPKAGVGGDLRAKYPEEITVVMQHQFWDLVVDDKGFQIGLSFNQMPQLLYVPYAAVTSFVDPSVKFGLQFRPQPGMEDNDDVPEAKETTALAPAPEAEPPSADSDNIVALDTFRKK
ncbi:MAG: ClpXP protease specificity-enhancing factor SspB [Alphaproteobacteria bacterium]|jgi:uncharacterized protein|nr:hypothetical protein [Rhodospirillaceae bacterium]MDG2482377.1 ClpXP protease specificity-enhancing factor SspB [Alphaproteobacteria bacterium]MBT6204883.1 hypothetical protein [Rhodospirillaceae bacterium]MBT6509874.1 hypothetical protein [Rhodospirillaceae bacterium]MBT7613249.1 hypothetical protein [Rhodospirillaceae bacterium]